MKEREVCFFYFNLNLLLIKRRLGLKTKRNSFPKTEMGVERVFFPNFNFSSDFHVPFTTSSQSKDNIKMNCMQLHVAYELICFTFGNDCSWLINDFEINPHATMT